MMRMDARFVQAYGLRNSVGTFVALYAVVWRLRESSVSGPSSTNYPKYEAAPGPPFVQMIIGSFSGLPSLSMKM